MFKVEVTDIICNLLIVQLLGKGVRGVVFRQRENKCSKALSRIYLALLTLPFLGN